MLGINADLRVCYACEGIKGIFWQIEMFSGQYGKIIAVGPEDQGLWVMSLQLGSKLLEEAITLLPALSFIVFDYILQRKDMKAAVFQETLVVLQENSQVIFIEQSCQFIIKEIGKSFFLNIRGRSLSDGHRAYCFPEGLEGLKMLLR